VEILAVDLLALLLPIAVVHLSAVITPGPNFLIVSRNSLTASRRAGLITAAAVALGAILWVFTGLLGFIAIVAQSALAFNVIKVFGTLYLIGIGLHTLLTRPDSADAEESSAAAPEMGDRAAFLSGLLTALSNPKSALYYLFLFTSLVPLDADAAHKLLIGALLVGISWGWYALLAVTFSGAWFRRAYRRAQRGLNMAFGGLWIGLGIKLATTTR
jgi:threonine/homoserine/homoserine lactone efflux protein